MGDGSRLFSWLFLEARDKVASRQKNIISNKLKFIACYSAKKEKMISTGNALASII